MSAYRLMRILVWFQLAGLAAVLLGSSGVRAQMLDRNGNHASDIWEQIYNAVDADLDQDSDGDGASNRQEAVGGTDPYDRRSLLRIGQYRRVTSGLELTIVGALGKRYTLESSEPFCGRAAISTNWITETSVVARASAVVTFNLPASLAVRLLRVIASDVDSDGDGLNDWEEYRLGLDPLSPVSNGNLDNNGQLLSDYRYLTNRLNGQTLAGVLAAAASAAGPSSLPFTAAALPTGAGLTGEYFTNSSSTYSSPANFNPANLFLTTNNAVVDFTWGPALSPNLSNGFYTVRWTGQVEPQYSETYFFQTRTDDGVKLWVNDQLLIDRWQLQGSTTYTNAITLVAGVRYNLRLEYFNRGGSARAQLSWFSPSQPRQVIPTDRLYPASGGYAPGAVTSPLTAIAFLGYPFSYTITGANSPWSYGATNLPPGLGLNPSNGVISGIPALAGGFDIPISVSNTVGIGNADLHLDVIDTGSAVTREIWTNAPGLSVADIPLHLAAALTNTLHSLEGSTNVGDNYGERIRGYLTPPVTGNYYFWLAANYSAELWISNDAEPVNRVRRAYVTRSTLPQQYTLLPTQRSGWLSLVAGQRYYIEVLHKAGKSATDHWSVAWLLDPTGTNTVPGGVVPGYFLSPFTNQPVSQIPGTLYSANMVAQSGAFSPGVGSATLRLSADEAQAVLKFTYSGLSAPVTAKHIHADTYLGKNNQGQIVFDIDSATPEADGSYIWTIAPSGALTAADIVEIIKQGKSYLNVHTVNYPAGEINGHFALTAGTAAFAPPPAAPAWTDDHTSSNAAVRFLLQATFGPSPAEVKSVRSLGYERWINRQFRRKVAGHLTNVFAMASSDPNSSYPGVFAFNTWWKQSVTASDQLRQRVAFALSEILVVSEAGVLADNGRALSAYYDVLLKHAFGNFRELLEATTLSPAMGLYLDMRRNDKASLANGTSPNENYAREILQLFSVGLNRMWPDGSLVLNSQGDIVPTYDQDVIIGYARVFTGWNYYQTNQANKRLPTDWDPDDDYIKPMVLVPTHHELGVKRLLDNVILPAAAGLQADSATTNFDGYCSQDLELALNAIFNNENVGPFVCRQLIQRLVTSHPSRDYVYRVVQQFNDNGDGVRGDMKAVIKAILLDYEARSPGVAATPTFGKQREPLLRATAVARAFPSPAPLRASYRQNGSPTVMITSSRPHRLHTGADVALVFTGKPAPTSQTYYDVTVSNANSFTITVPGVAGGTYGQSSSLLTITNSGHGLSVGHQIYLTFTSGGASNGVYTVASVVSGSVFTVNASDSAQRGGSCAFPIWNEGGLVQSGSNITFTVLGPHGLTVGKQVYVAFPGGSASPDGVYRIMSVPGPNRFTVNSSVSADDWQSDPLVLPLAPAPLVRSGRVTIRYSTWEMNYTDSGSSSSLSQTPLDAPTVFNYFFPDYKYQGILASAGLTTPEFQLTSDTSVVLQMNFISGGLFSNSGNTNGLSGFTGGNGAIMLDLGAWMTPANTADAGIPALVESLNTLLCAGQLSPAVKTIITSYVADTARFPYTIPTATQMRDRVRAVVHLIVSSPEFIIQR